jgi:RNase P subunit RPR2
MTTYDAEFSKILEEYEREYDLSTLNSANDRIALEQLIANQVLIRRWQRELLAVDDPTEVQRRTQAITSLIKSCQEIERQLKIDRKTRVGDNDVSVAQYIASLQDYAKKFLDERIQRVYCPRCGVMLFRYAPVHDHTAFMIEVTCSACEKPVRVQRAAKGTLDDVPPHDRAWRYRHPVTVTTAGQTVSDNAPPVLVIGDDPVNNNDPVNNDDPAHEGDGSVSGEMAQHANEQLTR